ncbi:hypothetical protein [Vibrio sinaloensis]|uniref:hypothetical protein n=1 Tax=Photobacterium sp. (strain ATCC 43367) TaxID=379097 RepID=UPI0022B07330|nr:hypothetical protein [Vibrio sinaloensis]MCZ4293191.1 hypothetical protein [Vibrio sinaloensis]
MKTNILCNLSLLSGSLSKPFKVQFLSICETLNPSKCKARCKQYLNIYSAFALSQGHQNFDTMNILIDKCTFQQHLDEVIGFIYEESEGVSLNTKKDYARVIHKVMCNLANINNIDITTQTFSHSKINDYTKHCIDRYKKLSVNKVTLTYLNGWAISSQESKPVSVNLDFVYVKYGRELTDKLHNVLKGYGLTQKSAWLRSAVKHIENLFESVSLLDKKGTIESFERLLNKSNVQATFLKAYHLQLSKCLEKNNDIRGFNHKFICGLDVYQTAFINTRTYPAPLKPFIRPEVKAVKNPPSFATGGKPSNLERLRWFVDIPLHIKDEQAVDIIKSRINRDMGFLKSVLINHFNALKVKQDRNKTYVETGWIKPLSGNRGLSKNDVFMRKKVIEIGPNHLANTIATFYHYGINGYEGYNYGMFLGYRGCVSELIHELNLPTNSTLFTLTALLVMEHPKITPAWLEKLQLVDENGKKYGYFQVGKQYILSSEKERRGRNLAQQDVILNAFSKSIVDFIVEHTETPRQHLKSIGNPDWKYLLLTSTLNNVAKPKAGSALYKPMTIVTELLNNKAYLPVDHDVQQSDVEAIARITTHRAIRRHRGLQIYLETRSQSSVADALGHKEVQPQLLTSYLPKPLMEFFTERVVRQFQKAIILKAMQDSPHLLDAVNMTYEDIEEFLENHGLNDMPVFNAESFDNVASNVESSCFDRIVFTVSVPLIQLLISIKTIVDSDNDESSFNELIQHWYQSACYILNRFELDDFSGDDDIEVMYQTAKMNPLNHNIIKGVISC